MLINVGGKLINTSQILWVEPATPIHNTPRSTIKFVTGDTITVSMDMDWLGRQQDQVVPAPTGYQMIQAIPPHQSDADQTVGYEVLPVIAFRFRGERINILEPITPEGTPGDYFATVGPDGRCWDWDREYPSIEAYKQSFSEDWAKAHQSDDSTAS